METKQLNMQDKIFQYTNILINESNEYDDIEKVGVGGRIWKSSVMLSAILKSEKLKNLIDFENKNILEVGAGAGICGIVCSTLNINKITITDRDPGCLQLIEKNILENKEKLNLDRIEIKCLDWCNREQLGNFKGNYDIIIGSDLIYSGFMIEPLCKALEFLCETNKYILISLADRGGEESDFNVFFSYMIKFDKFDITVLPENFLEEKFEKIVTLLMKKK